MESPLYLSRSGFSIIKTNSLINGGGKIQYSLDSGQSHGLYLPNDNLQSMTEPHFNVMFKIVWWKLGI